MTLKNGVKTLMNNNRYYILRNVITGDRLLLKNTTLESVKPEAKKKALLSGWYHSVIHVHDEESKKLVSVIQIFN